ncbi:hypothetical protein ACFQ0K_09755 [Nocardioides caeni]|nr:hypothetical protein [Nocardioides caeni]
MNDQLDGGAGDDTFLVGGAHRDRGRGDAGRDRCVVEVGRTCER